MFEATALLNRNEPTSRPEGHRRWVRICHWMVAATFLMLAVTGVLILIAHYRLCPSELGNGVAPAPSTLSISDNPRLSGLRPTAASNELSGALVSVDRNVSMFKRNGWQCGLHLLAAWVLVGVGACYFLIGTVTGHITRNLVPRIRELTPPALWRDLRSRLRPHFESAGTGPPYGSWQKLAYTSVVFIALPLMVATGVILSPAIAAAYPFLLDWFGGYQSARIMHFLGFSALTLFLIVHVAMVVATGLRRHLRAMIWGNSGK